jgi:phytoene dehydrogenase-like protein
MDKSIIIIGSGIAGLSAGCYGQMNGYDTQIFEMDTRPGGLCTSWKRKGYTIDGCIHWLVGSGPASSVYGIWEELGIMKAHTFVDYDEFLSIEGSNGKSLSLYADLERLENHMKELAPEDSELIEDFVQGVRKLTGFDLPVDKAPELTNIFDKVKMLFGIIPYLGFTRKWSKMTTRQFANQFKSPFMREVFSGAVGDLMDIPMLGVMMPLAWLNQKTAGYPLGGSLKCSRTIEKRYLDLGGKVNYKSKVVKILVENDHAVGIKLADGIEHRADIIISAADGRTTIFDMLEGKYVDDKVKGLYDNPSLTPPLLHVAYGVARTFDELPCSMCFNILLDKPITIADKENTRLLLYIYNFDSNLAPKGKTIIKFMVNTEWDYWNELYKNPDSYKAEKGRLANELLTILDKRFPGLSSQVEMVDVATPVTWVRYTGSWKGSYMGWMKVSFGIDKPVEKTLPGLGSFYMAGHWVESGGGIPPAAQSGRNAIQLICNKDKKRFVTSTP